jgi:hypothetical protein
MIDALTLKRLLHYDPDTGIFRWLVSPSRSVPAGAIAGWENEEGYRRIKVGERAYPAGALAWLYMTGEYPPEEVDHRDLNPSNNRWPNLRCSDRSGNNANRRVMKSNLLGAKGVRSLHGKVERFAARIWANGYSHHLGVFATQAAAQSAYDAAAKKFFGAFARSSFDARSGDERDHASG